MNFKLEIIIITKFTLRKAAETRTGTILSSSRIGASAYLNNKNKS